MRTRVQYTVDLPDWWREEVCRYFGGTGLATREECISWLRSYGTSMDDELALNAQRREQEIYDLIAEIGAAT